MSGYRVPEDPEPFYLDLDCVSLLHAGDAAGRYDMAGYAGG